jgi:hypothetical protein
VGELADLALKAAKEDGGIIPPEHLKIYVTIRVSDKEEVLADVIVGQGIGRPCWLVTIGRNMKVLKCVKEIGRG